MRGGLLFYLGFFIEWDVGHLSRRIEQSVLRSTEKKKNAHTHNITKHTESELDTDIHIT